MRQWYYAPKGNQTGPISEEELINLFLNESIPGDTYVWITGMPQWLPVEKSELYALISQAKQARAQLIASEEISHQSLSEQGAKEDSIQDSYLACEDYEDVSLTEEIFYPVSIKKFILMSYSTFGFYELYWFYKNWKNLKENHGSDVSPTARTIFAAFFVFPLADRIKKQLEIKSMSVATNPIFFAFVFFVMSLFWRQNGITNLLSFFSFLPLVPLQNMINNLNKGITEPESDFSTLEIIICLAGGLLATLGIMGRFLTLQ